MTDETTFPPPDDEISLLDPDTEHAVRAFLEKAARQYDVTGAILFGSRARRGHRPDSAADVAVPLRGQPGEFICRNADCEQRRC